MSEITSGIQMRTLGPIIAKIIITILFSAVMLWCYQTSFRSDNGLDFRVIYSAAQILKSSSQLVLPEYPPVAIALYVPVTRFPIQIAYILWTSLSLITLGLSAFLLNWMFHMCRDGYWAYLLSFVFLPTHILLLQGQMDAVVLLAFVFALLAMRSGRDFLAGAALALGLIKFYLVLPFVFVMILRRRWFFLSGFAAGTAIFAIACAAIAGLRFLLAYPKLIARVALGVRPPTTEGYSPIIMANLRGLYFFATGREMSLVALGVISLLALIWISRQWQTLEQGFAGTLVATVLLSYHLNPHDLVLLLIPIAIALIDINFASISGIVFLLLALPILPRLALASHCFPLITILIGAFGVSLWKRPAYPRLIPRAAKRGEVSP